MIKTTDTYQKIIEVIKLMNPTLTLTDIQKDFINFCIEILHNAKGNEINVIPGRCGLAKSTFIRALIQIMLENPYEGAIIVTNSIERLSDMRYKEADDRDNSFEELYIKNSNKIALLTASNKELESKTQRYKPILLMTTQRYNLLEREQIQDYLSYEYQGKKCKRTYVIFDEEPSFHSFQQVGDKELNNIDTALRNGITDLCDAKVKDWMLKQWESFRTYIQEQFRQHEYLRTQNTFIYWKGSRTSLTEDDEKFNKVIEKFQPTIRGALWNFADCMENCLNLVQKGAILSITKAKDKDTYSKQFWVIRNKFENYLLGENVKTIVFDATADVSAKYDELADGLDGNLIIHNCERFNPSLSYMKIKIVNINTSRNALIKSEKATKSKEIINNYLAKESIPTNDVLFATYKDLYNEQCFSCHGYTEYGYIGNLRGFNKYNRLHNYVQVGLNRQRDSNYLALLLHNQPEYIDFALSQKNVEKNIEFMDKLIASDSVADIRNADIAADLIQNIFRTCARNIDNTDEVNVYLFFDVKQYAGLIDDLNYHFVRLGAKMETVELMALAEDKIQSRQFADGMKSHAQLIVEWIRGLSEGYQFTTSELMKAVGINSKQLEKARKKNQKLKEYMDSMKIKKGVYKKITF